MCLSGFGDLEVGIKALRFTKRGYTTMWKVFGVDRNDELVGDFGRYSYYEGKNTAVTDYLIELFHWPRRYQAGFHCFITKEAAKKWLLCTGGCGKDVVPVKVRKAWITTVGHQNTLYQGRLAVAICKHMII